MAATEEQSQKREEVGWISASSMRAVLSYPSLIDALQSAFARSHLFCMPDRHHYPLVPSSTTPSDHNATLLVMPAWSNPSATSNAFIGVKVATVFPRNSLIGLPAVSASYLLLSAETGAPLCVLDGKELTLWRTACASALAAKFLAKDQAHTLVMVGAGAMAPHLIRAHIAARPSLNTVFIWNKTAQKASELAGQLAKDSALEGVDFKHCRDLEIAIGKADIVSCATLSKVALVEGGWLKPGVHLDLVGSFTPAMRECDDEAVRRARVYVDSSMALTESGELVGAFQRGAISPQDVVGDLSELARGEKVGRQTDKEVTLFKSVGCALEDLATAALIHSKLHG